MLIMIRCEQCQKFFQTAPCNVDQIHYFCSKVCKDKYFNYPRGQHIPDGTKRIMTVNGLTEYYIRDGYRSGGLPNWKRLAVKVIEGIRGFPLTRAECCRIRFVDGNRLNPVKGNVYVADPVS